MCDSRSFKYVSNDVNNVPPVVNSIVVSATDTDCDGRDDVNTDPEVVSNQAADDTATQYVGNTSLKLRTHSCLQKLSTVFQKYSA